MKTVSQVAKLTGCSVRTLHHYDAIGLLKPTQVTEAGYRLYDRRALERLNLILLFRELAFPLKEIRQILDHPHLDLTQVLQSQITLLQMRRQKLDQLIAHAKTIQETGVINMDFTPYDHQKLDDYARQAKARWGDTDAYKEYASRKQDPAREKEAARALMDLFRQLGTLRQLPPEAEAVQQKVEALRRCITENYYTCTPQILRGLAEMYAAGGEMTENIDRAGGPGTGSFAREAILIYCSRQS